MNSWDQMDGSALSKPPEGVISGDSIPRENEDKFEMLVDKLVGIYKERGYKQMMSEQKLERKAREKAKEMMNNE